jgi:hypothetical protein
MLARWRRVWFVATAVCAAARAVISIVTAAHNVGATTLMLAAGTTAVDRLLDPARRGSATGLR